MIGQENSRHSLNQSDANLKPITTCSPAFSRALRNLLVSALSSDWVFKVFYLSLLDNFDYNGFK